MSRRKRNSEYNAYQQTKEMLHIEHSPMVGWPEELHDTLQMTLDQLYQLIEYDGCAIFLLSDEIIYVAASRGNLDVSGARQISLSVKDFPGLYNLIVQGPSVLQEDLTNLFPPDFLRDFRNPCSGILAPLTYHSRPMGLLAMVKAKPGCYTEKDVQSAQAFANHAAVTIENACLFREMRRQFETMHALHGIAVEITSQLEDQQVLGAIVQQAAHLLETSGGLLAICEPQTELLRVEALHNIPSEYKEATAPSGEGLWGQIMATGKPAIVNDYRLWVKENPSLRTTNPENWPYNAVLAVPLILQGRVIGLLMVLHAGERRPFTQDDARILSLLASLASTAINNAQLYSQVLQLSRQLEQKVEEREAELSSARDELAQKAEQLQRLLTATVRVQEEERSRIATDLHDGSNQLIAGATFEIQAAQESIKGKRMEDALEKLESVKTLLRQIEAANRRSIAGLRPPLLDTHGLIHALKWQVVNYRDSHGIDCMLHVYGRENRMSTDVETAVYRIIQESLSNVATHAKARNVKIRLDFTPTILHAVVEDDGVGFNPENVSIMKPGRLGLIGMRERAQSIGGQVEIHSLPGRGTRVVVDVPLSSGSRH